MRFALRFDFRGLRRGAGVLAEPSSERCSLAALLQRLNVLLHLREYHVVDDGADFGALPQLEGHDGVRHCRQRSNGGKLAATAKCAARRHGGLTRGALAEAQAQVHAA